MTTISKLPPFTNEQINEMDKAQAEINKEIFDLFRYEVAKKKATFQAKKYLKDNGYNDVIIHCSRGTFHLTNGEKYFLSAAHVLNQATGLKFTALNVYMARLDKTQF